MTAPLCTYGNVLGSTSSVGGAMSVYNPAVTGELGVIIVMRRVSAFQAQTFTASLWTQVSGAAINNGDNLLCADAFYSTTHNGGTVNLNSSYGTSSNWVAFSGVFTGFNPTTPIIAGGGNGAASNASGSSGNNINPGVVDDYTWLDFCATTYGGSSFSFGFPGNMPDNRAYTYANSPNSSSSCEIGIAMKSSNASSFTSWGWSFSNNSKYLNRIFAIQPAAAVKARSQLISLWG